MRRSHAPPTPEQIDRLLTTHVRTRSRLVRFCANPLPSMLRCGHITPLPQRLQEIRQFRDSLSQAR